MLFLRPCLGGYCRSSVRNFFFFIIIYVSALLRPRVSEADLFASARRWRGEVSL